MTRPDPSPHENPHRIFLDGIPYVFIPVAALPVRARSSNREDARDFTRRVGRPIVTPPDRPTDRHRRAFIRKIRRPVVRMRRVIYRPPGAIFNLTDDHPRRQVNLFSRTGRGKE